MVRRVNLPSLPWFFCVALTFAFYGVFTHAETARSTLLHATNIPGFVVAPSISVSAPPTGVAAGDLNGDGRPDLVITTSGPGVTVFLANGNGGFGSGVQVAAGVQPGNPLLADLNGDGKLDLVVTDAAAGAIDVLFGNGDGTFGKSVAYTAIQNPIGLALGNFSGKGKIDLAVASASGLVVLLNDESGHFPAATTVAIKGQPSALSAADLTGTGHDDIILANQDGTVGILLGDGKGGFQPFIASSVASGPLSAIVSRDFNGDGRADIAVTQAGANTVTVLLGRGDGTFQPGVAYTVGNGPAFVMSADLRGNGHSDLITINQAANTFSVLEGNGDGTFRPAQDFVAGNSPIAAAAGDFNSDGHADLAIANYGDSTISVPLGRGDATLIAARSYRGGLATKSIAAGDLNGDGRPDLVVANSCGSDSTCTGVGSASVFLAGVNGTYSLASTIPLGGGPAAVALADLSGDKKLDLLALNRIDKTLTVMAGNGDGTFAKAQTYTLSASPRAIFVGDFNGDGHPDVAIAMDCGQQVCAQRGSVDVWLGHSDGSLTESNSYAAGFSPVSIAAADLRGTGHLDLIVANVCGSDSSCKSDGTATVLAGDGTGKFTPFNEIDIGPAPSSIAVGNLSGSGLDLAVALSGSNQIAVMHSNGSGGFNPPVSYAVGSAPSSLVIADVNGDGKPDVAVANFQSSTVSVLLGTGTGTLQSATADTVGTGPESLVAVSGASGTASLATANGNSGSSSVGNSITALGSLVDPGTGTPTFTFTPTSITSTVDASTSISVTVAGDSGPAAVGSTVTFNWLDSSSAATTLTDCGTGGTVSLDANGSGTCATQQLPVAAVGVNVNFSGDPNYAATTSTAITATITATGTSVTVNSTSPTSPAVDAGFTVKATVSPSPSAPVTVPFSGTMSFYLDGNATAISGCSALAVDAASGVANCTVAASATLTAGSHHVTAQYNSGDTNYNASPMSASFPFTVSKSGTSITVNSISPTSPPAGQAFSITATVSPSPSAPVTVPFSGTMSFYLDGSATAISGCSAITVNTTSGAATCPAPASSTLTPGSHFVTAQYNSGDTNYNASSLSAQFSFTAAKANTTTVVTSSSANNTSAVNSSVTFTATVTAPSNNIALSGNVTFTDNGSTITNGSSCGNSGVVAVTWNSSNSTGTAACTTGALKGGSHSIVATYGNDANYNNSNNNVAQTVNPAPTTVSAPTLVSPASPVVDQTVTVSATVTSQAPLTVPFAGAMTFFNGGTAISGCSSVTVNTSTGVAQCQFSGLAASTASSPSYSITAQYNTGDASYSQSAASSALSLVIGQASTSVSVSASPSPSTVNQSVTFTATITPGQTGSIGLTGTVTFTDSVTSAAIPGCSGVALTVSGGKTTAACTYAGLSLASHTITAAYGNDPNFSANSGNVPLNVTAASSNITLTSSNAASTVNQIVTFTASIPAPSGNTALKGQVLFTDTPQGGTPVTIAGCSAVSVTATSSTNYTAPCPDANLTAVGSPHTITATYMNDPNFAVGGGTIAQTVNKASTSVALGSSQNPSLLNQSVTFTATVAPSPSGNIALGGTVAFTDSVTSVAIPGCSAVSPGAGGAATCVTSALAVSPPSHTITATYGNDSNFNGSSTTFVQTVNPTTGAITLTPPSGTTTTVNTSVTFTATIPIPTGLPAPKGVLTFTDNGNPISSCPAAAPSSNWTATCTDQALTAGPHTIVAAYTGDSNVSVNNGTTNITVMPAASTTLLVSSLNPSFAFLNNSNSSEYTVTFTATVSAPAGATVPLSQGTVSFSGNGIPASCTAVVPVGGIATCTTAILPSGVNNIIAAYGGDPNYSNSSSNTVPQSVQDYSISVANVPTGSLGFLVTLGYTSATDPYPQAQPIAVLPASFAGFSSAGVTLACPTPAAGAPACKLATNPVPITGASAAVQASSGIVIDATGANVVPGTYNFTVTATDSTSSIVRTATFVVTVRGSAVNSSALTVISGATTNNTGNLTFGLPAGVTLSNLQCASVTGTAITSPEAPASIGIGCTITPTSLGSTTSTSAQDLKAAVTVTTNGTVAAVTPMHLGNRHSAFLVAGVFGIPFIAVIGFLRRRSLKSGFFTLVVFVTLGIAAFQTTGCGGSYHASNPQVGGGTTPVGTYYLLVEGKGSDGNTYSAVLQLNVGV